MCLYPEEWRIQHDRDDITYYPIPVKALVDASDTPPNLTSYVSNMAYVGVLASLLNIDMEQIQFALEFHFDRKAKPVGMNMAIVRAAYEWAQDNLAKRIPSWLSR